MIDLYYGPTPNGQKISIALTELGLPYELHMIDTLAGDQFRPEFLAINPNNKQPAIIDREGPGGAPITVWESGAILIYLAEKTGRLLPKDPRERSQVLTWLFFQVAGLGPMGGQMAFFGFYAKEKIPLAIDRYWKEINRQMVVMDRHLMGREYFGRDYSIADIAILPWWLGLSALSMEERPALNAWAERLMSREAVRKGLDLKADEIPDETIARGQAKPMSDETYSALYGDKQYEAR